MTYWQNDANLYLEDGIIWDLTPYIQEYAPAYYAFLQSNPAYDRAMKTDEGQYYTFGFFREDGGWNDTYLGPVIRTDWLEECGLEAPKTVSEFENVIRVFNEKYGAKFSFAWSRFQSTGISGAFGAFGASDETWFVQDGVVDLAQAQPEWRTYVSWLNKLWEEGLLDQDSLSLDDTSIKAKVHNDQVGISITSMGTTVSQPVKLTSQVAAAPRIRPASPSFNGTSREKNSRRKSSGTRTLSRFSGEAR